MGKTGDRNEEIGERGSENGNRDLPYGFPFILKELRPKNPFPCLSPLRTSYCFYHLAPRTIFLASRFACGIMSYVRAV